MIDDDGETAEQWFINIQSLNHSRLAEPTIANELHVHKVHPITLAN